MRFPMGMLGRALVVLCALPTLSGCGVFGLGGDAPAPGSPTRAELEQLLATVQVVAVRPHPGGYERGCRAEQRCVFGPAWSDNHDGPGGHDGCDTRNNVLARQLMAVAFRPGTRDCVVVSGVLDDPYTGQRIAFDKTHTAAVQIDHVYPLAAAWDMGAFGWSSEQRMRFANDLDYNLLAVDGKTNEDKGDSTPARWLPPHPGYHCFYAGKYLGAAGRYGLPISDADRTALARVVRACP